MKRTLVIARILSGVFRPTYYPIVGVFLLLMLTYMKILPWQVKGGVLALIYLFTIALPALGVYIYRKLYGLKSLHLRHQSKRLVPYALHLCSYGATIYLMWKFHLPSFMIGIMVAALGIQALCLLINLWWKISIHSAGAGGLIGALIAYSMLFEFDPTWWLCGTILLCGMVMTSRMLLRQHTLGQVFGGAVLGILCGYFGLILIF